MISLRCECVRRMKRSRGAQEKNGGGEEKKNSRANWRKMCLCECERAHKRHEYVTLDKAISVCIVCTYYVEAIINHSLDSAYCTKHCVALHCIASQRARDTYIYMEITIRKLTICDLQNPKLNAITPR